LVRFIEAAALADFQKVPALSVGHPLAAGEDLRPRHRRPYLHRLPSRGIGYALVSAVEFHVVVEANHFAVVTF